MWPLLFLQNGFEHGAFGAKGLTFIARYGARIGQVGSGGVHASGLRIERRTRDVKNIV
jgi:hypothetical protein